MHVEEASGTIILCAKPYAQIMEFIVHVLCFDLVGIVGLQVFVCAHVHEDPC